MTNTQAASEQEPAHLRIEMRAYEIWLHEGCPNGHELDHWLKAESELASETTSDEKDGKAPPKDTK